MLLVMIVMLALDFCGFDILSSLFGFLMLPKGERNSG